jgi:hypothetical protein
MKSGLLATVLCVLVFPGPAFAADLAPQRPSIAVPQAPSPLVKPSPVPRVVAPFPGVVVTTQPLTVTGADATPGPFSPLTITTATLTITDAPTTTIFTPATIQTAPLTVTGSSQ